MNVNNYDDLKMTRTFIIRQYDVGTVLYCDMVKYLILSIEICYLL